MPLPSEAQPPVKVFADFGRVYLVAEIGVNHNGDLGLARRLVAAAKAAGADAVKFQTFTAETLATALTPKVAYQERTTPATETHFGMLRDLELGRTEHRQLFAYCEEVGVDFISTPYDLDSAKFLSELGVAAFKTASADITDLPLHEYIASTGTPAIVATGMANLGEIESVVEIYRRHGHPKLFLLHCVSSYPCSDASLNLRAMPTIAAAFGLPVGYSDHSEGSVAAVTAVALGARIIEKHFTLDKALVGPDHRASSTPEEFAEIRNNVRRAEQMLGTARKACQEEEREMATVSRKSVVLSRPMRAGDVLSRSDLQLLRPGTGLPSSVIPLVEGLRLRGDRPLHHQLSWTDLDPA